MSSRTNDWTLRRRLVYTFLIAGVFSLVIVLLTAASLYQTVDRTSELIDKLGPARTASFQLESAFLDQETGVRGYALTGQADFLQPYNDGLSHAKTYLTQAAKLQDQDDLHRDLDKVRQLADTWRAQYAEPAIAAEKAHKKLPTAQVEGGKRLFDQLRGALSAFQNDLTKIRASLKTDLNRAVTTLTVVAIAAVILLVIAGLMLWRALSRWVLEPLSKIGTETRQVVGGALTHRVTVEGPQEITTLAADVDAMRGSLVAALSGAVTAQDRLREQTAQLEAQTEDLRRSNTELEQFAYVASHDLQEPLRKVASFCQMLSRRYSGELDERGQQYIDFAVDGAKRMQRLINDLLAFSRVGRTTGEFEDIGLDKVLDRALTSLGSTIEESDAEIVADQLPIVHGNAILLTQVFQNLIGNAIKFHGMAAPRVRITVDRKGDHYEFACSDNGIGIEPQYAERVFVIFQRLHGKDQYDGTGIGLAMVRKIVEHHGGHIWLDTESASGGGTTFRWTLPVPSTGEPVPATGQPSTDQPTADQLAVGTGTSSAAPTDSADSAGPSAQAEGVIDAGGSPVAAPEAARGDGRAATIGVGVARTESDA